MRQTLRRWNTGSRRLACLFLLVVVPSAGTLIWLGVRLVEADRRLWTDRDLERREAAADVVVGSLSAALASAVEVLPGGRIPDGALAVTLSSAGARTMPQGRALWSPSGAGLPEAMSTPFDAAETDEFRQTGDQGLGVYAAIARSDDPHLRAGALLRLARVHRASGRRDRAIEAYRELAKIPGISHDGMPMDLLARRHLCALFEQAGRTADLAREAAALEADLVAAHWVLDQSGWEHSAEQISRWTGRPVPVTAEQRAVTAAADWLWNEWQRRDEGALARAGRQSLQVDGVPLTLQWRAEREAVYALVISPDVASTWARQSAPIALVDPATVILTDETGAVVSGVRPERGVRLVTRPARDTGLPWTISVSPNPAMDFEERQARSHLLSWGLGALVLLLTGGSYLLWRVVQRELAVARIHADFVAAVSHEFRTPLTALQHATELLQEDDHGQERRQSMYGVFGRNTARLRQLVDSLLDFARMEDGRKAYELRPTDAVALVQRVTAEFRRQAAPPEARISLDVPSEARLMIDADPTAFSLALWNLLDNAVKYSPAPQTVAVAVEPRLDRVVVAVRDHGYGIPHGERRDVFHKFVRGRDTERRGIKGTGLGLAIVSRIVRAHGGQVELESEIARGSIFRLVLPASR